MKSLYESILDNDKIDGHIHLFDHDGIIDSALIDTSKRCVCFADVAFRYLEKYKNGEIIKYYDTFINKHHNPLRHILLATGITAEEIIAIHKKYPQYIKGFGELKCYSEWKEGKLPYGNLDWIKPVMKYNRKFKMPVYIHYNLDSKKHCDDFESLLASYPEMPIILCHCGMVDDINANNTIFNFVKLLQTRYDNLWVDISKYESCSFFMSNPEKLQQLNQEKIIIGSDINPIIEEVINDPKEYSYNCYRDLNVLSDITKSTNNIKRLFDLQNSKCNTLIELYQRNLRSFNRHHRIHLLSRGYLIGMYGKSTIKRHYKDNVKAVNELIDLFNSNAIDDIVNKYVIIGYTENDRKRKIGDLFKSCNNTYKKYLSIVSLLELVYTFKRVDLMHLLDIKKISNVLSANMKLITNAITEDKYDFKHKAATKYINALFFIYNLKDDIDVLKDAVSEKIYDDVIQMYLDMYRDNPSTTTMYGLTHILIGSSNFYIKQPEDKYKPIADAIYKYLLTHNNIEDISVDTQIEMMLCCKLFCNSNIVTNMDRYISFDKLEEEEHTNMIYILLNKLNAPN